ncbi:peptide-methionine (S)-S-oxide reductase MsrA [Sphingobacterium suaedae]|uniref:Peptide methionine sulfoxide reductase MsrA n=1 Tax=Sphingobacterium suaedae TaxID=1686402 RepID=A0ABW5KJP6_9SPHI
MKNLILYWIRSIFVLASVYIFVACAQPAPKTKHIGELPERTISGLDTATFGAGCFWCVEAQFATLKGVHTVLSGYSGGTVANPTYSQVSNGTTGHAEVVQIVFDTAQISFDELLEAFFIAHDPTQLNRQGNDVGTQYRSVVFVHSEEQYAKCTYYIDRLNQTKVYDKPIVTVVEPFTIFYRAEDYHQQYYAKNGKDPYCTYVIRPKMEKFTKVFKERLK